MAAALNNKQPKDMAAICGFVDTIGNTKEANYGHVQRMACKIAAEAFAEAGRKKEFEYHMLDSLSKSAVWYPELDQYSDAVFNVLGKLAYEYEKEKDESLKDAVVAKSASFLPGLVSSTAKLTPDAIKAMALAGAFGGTATGGLYWLLNRHAEEDEDKAEQVKAKINYYNRISNEIKNQLGKTKLPPAAIADKVQEIMENQNLF